MKKNKRSCITWTINFYWILLKFLFIRVRKKKFRMFAFSWTFAYLTAKGSKVFVKKYLDKEEMKNFFLGWRERFEGTQFVLKWWVIEYFIQYKLYWSAACSKINFEWNFAVTIEFSHALNIFSIGTL